MSRADFKFSTPVRVRWMECDAQGIVFNGAYMGYLEIAQAEYFRHLGFSIYKVAQRAISIAPWSKRLWSSKPRPGWTTF